jgi:hypothetical protein
VEAEATTATTILILLLISNYYSLSSKDKENLLLNTAISIENYLNDPVSIFSVGLFLITFYCAVYLFSIPMGTTNKPLFIGIIENIAIIMFILILIIDFFKYILTISFIDLLKKMFSRLWNGLPSDSPIVAPSPIASSKISKNEVFNISNNLYTYDDAQAICKSYGSRLATYDDIEQSYNDGAEWCNYGWSEGQMAYFPTQKSTWNKLQKDEKTKNNCGRPGINGGYMANPYLKFGVNCFGQKPAPSDKDLNRLKQQKNVYIPETEEEVVIDKKVEFWKENADKLLVINSFNHDKWSEY